MAIKRTINLGGRDVEVTEVSIQRRSGEMVGEYELEDKSIIRVANPVMVVYRLDNTYDPEGNAVYIVRVGTSVTTVTAPTQNRNRGPSNGGNT